MCDFIIKEPHTAFFSGVMGCGKTQLVLDLLETYYLNHYEYIIILCSTLRHNRTYIDRVWIKTDQDIWLVEPKEKLNKWIKVLSLLLIDRATLFILDDLIADESLNKRRTSLLELCISCRHLNHSMWFLTQSYTAIPKDLRRFSNMIFCWYQKERSDIQLIHKENEVLTNEELSIAKTALKASGHANLFIRTKHPRTWKILS